MKNFNFKTALEFRNEVRKNDKIRLIIPTNPEKYYKEFTTFSNFLSNDSISTSKLNFYEFKKARNIIRKMKIKTISEYKIKHKNKELTNFPLKPFRTYKDLGWIDWSDFLGIEIIANQNKKYFTLLKIKKMIKHKNFKNKNEYIKYVKENNLSNEMPLAPNIVFKNFNGWDDFLGKK